MINNNKNQLNELIEKGMFVIVFTLLLDRKSDKNDYSSLTEFEICLLDSLSEYSPTYTHGEEQKQKLLK